MYWSKEDILQAAMIGLSLVITALAVPIMASGMAFSQNSQSSAVATSPDIQQSVPPAPENHQ